MTQMINVNGKFIPVRDETVLEALEKAGVEVFSQCRDGFCGACTCKAENPNSVLHNKNVIASFDADSEILACSAKVKDGEILMLTL
jgi:ferredoxin